MSVEALTLVLHHSKASGAAKLLLLGVANHQGDSGAWPSIATLAKYTNVSERRVQQLLRELEVSGELVIKPQAGGFGQYKTNLYWINLACPSDCDGTVSHRPGVKSGVDEATRGEVLDTSGVKSGVARGEAGFALTVIEPNNNQIDNVRTSFEQECNSWFEQFWAVYPRRQGKGGAIKAFQKALGVASGQEILDGVTRFARDPNLPALQFIPMAATWLNQERWSDEALPERQLNWREKQEADAKVRMAPVEQSRVGTYWRRSQDEWELVTDWDDLTPANRAFLTRIGRNDSPLSSSAAKRVDRWNREGINVPEAAMSLTQAMTLMGIA